MFNQYHTIVENILSLPNGTLTNPSDDSPRAYSFLDKNQTVEIHCFDHSRFAEGYKAPIQDHFSFFVTDEIGQEKTFLFFENLDFHLTDENASFSTLFSKNRSNYKFFVLELKNDDIKKISNYEDNTLNVENDTLSVQYLNESFRPVSTDFFSFKDLHKIGLFDNGFFSVFRIKNSL